MVNKKDKVLKDVGYDEIEIPKEELSIKTRVSKNNPSVNRNSQLGGKF